MSKISIQDLRESLNIKQKIVRDELGLSQSLISKIENGKSFGKGFYKYLQFLVEKGVDVNPLFKE